MSTSGRPHGRAGGMAEQAPCIGADLGQRLPAWAHYSDISGIHAVYGGVPVREALKSIVGSHPSLPGGFERGKYRYLDGPCYSVSVSPSKWKT